MGTGSFPGVKRPGRGVDHPALSSAEVKERVELYFYSPPEPSWPILGIVQGQFLRLLRTTFFILPEGCDVESYLDFVAYFEPTVLVH